MSGLSRLHPALDRLGRPALVASAAVTALVLGLRHLDVLETWELGTYDQNLRWRDAFKELTNTKEEPDPRLLLVTVTEEDIQAQKQYPLSDAVVARVLTKLEQYEPAAIGLDIYRDIPVQPGHEAFATLMKNSDRIFAVCKSPEVTSPGTPPPPSAPSNRVGFSDIPVDPGGPLRRGLLWLDPSAGSRCTSKLSISFQLALKYLEKKGINPKTVNDNELQLGSTIIKRLPGDAGGYNAMDNGGNQVLLNYRSPTSVAQEITLTDVLQDKLKPEWVKDRIVLIGVTASSIDDAFYTPFSAGMRRNQKMPGVVIHAQLISQILASVLDGRSLFWFWPEWGETLWIWGWSLCGGVLAWRLRSPERVLLAEGGALVVLLGTSWVLFLQAGWIPIVAPAFSLVATCVGVMAYSAYEHQQEQKKFALQAQKQEQLIVQLQALLTERTGATASVTQPWAEDATQPWPSEETPPWSEDGTQPWAEDATQPWPAQNTTETPTDDATALLPQQEASKPSADKPKPAVTSSLRPLLGGRYKILRVLAQGGFGRTYMAADTNRPGNPECVIKHLKPARSDEKFMRVARRLFDTEAEILEQLGRHPQIPQLLAYFEENQEFYLAEEFVAGHPLSDELPVDKRLPESYVLDLIKGILEVLAFIHEHRVIHRDIKPGNIIRREQDGKLVLIDFGAVKQIRPQENDDAEGRTVAIGTKGYAPAEQYAGQPTLSSDIFAVGMIGIQALTGIQPYQLPQDPNTGNVTWRHLTVGPNGDSLIREEVGEILEKMVRYHFVDRYQTATAVLKDLKAL